MSTFLDLRTSQGNGTGNLGLMAAPTFLGAIGLIVGTATTGIRVNLNATVSVLTTNAADITIQILRNQPATTITTYDPARVIYSSTHQVAAIFDQIIGVNAADFNPPTSATEPGQINYSLFAWSSVADTSINGRPQTLNGTAAFG